MIDQWQTNDHLKDIHPIANLTYEDEEKETTEKEKIIILFLKSERFSNTSFGHFIEFLAILSEHFRSIDIRRTRFIRFCKTKQKTTKSNKTFENLLDTLYRTPPFSTGFVALKTTIKPTNPIRKIVFLPSDHRLARVKWKCILFHPDKLKKNDDFTVKFRRKTSFSTVGMKNFADKLHFRRTQWIIRWKMQSSDEHSEFKRRTTRSTRKSFENKTLDSVHQTIYSRYQSFPFE